MTATKTPIIYWYTFGSLRRDLLGETLEDRPLLPALAEFGQRSVRFGNAFSSSGSPLLSATSMLTGMWPTRLGVKDCPIRVKGQGICQAFGLDSGLPTLPGRLAESGFSTFSHPDSLTPSLGDGLDRGFTHPGALPDRIDEGKGVFIWHQAKGANPHLEPTGLALDALGLEKTEESKEPRDLYRAAAFDADRSFARAMGELSEAGLWDQTLVIVTAASGLELYDHGGFGAATGLYQENLAVPLFLKFPSSHPLADQHGQKIDCRIRLIDLAPTVAILGTGQGLPDSDGESLLPLINGEEQGDRDLIGFHSALAEDAGEPVIHEALAVTKGSKKAMGGFRAGGTKDQEGNLRPAGDEIRELYDLDQDPDESVNIVDREPELFQEMMIRAASVAAPLGTSGEGQPSAHGEEEKEALVEKLRSLGYI